MTDPINLPLRNCVRCGKHHEDVLVEPFGKRPPTIDGDTYTHWALCPDTGEPIMLRFHLEAD